MEERNELEHLKEFKKESGLSYQKIAEHLGISIQTVYFWFSGKFNPSPLAREKIRKLLRAAERAKQKEHRPAKEKSNGIAGLKS